MTRFVSKFLLPFLASSIGFAPGSIPSSLPGADDAAQDSAQIAAETARMGFMVGEWRVDARIRSGQGYMVGTGAMSVQFKEDGTTMLADVNIPFPGFTVLGTTRRIYNPARKLWDVDWITGNANSVLGIEGRFQDGRFIEIDFGANAIGPYIGRLVISEMTDDHFLVRKDRLYDDGSVAAEVWTYEATRTGGEPRHG
jgi:hypothetical protein